MEQQTLTIPNEVISPTDIARLVRELENLDEFFRQSAIREAGTPQSAPRYSRLLDKLVVSNELNLLQGDHRENLLSFMKNIATKAPILHISFSVDPPGAYVQKIVTWLRSNIDGRILVRVGLQPNIGAGCVVRTTNKSFDFSLRRFFDSKKDFFAAKLHEVVSADATPVTINTTAKSESVISEPQTNTNPDVSATETANTEPLVDSQTTPPQNAQPGQPEQTQKIEVTS